MMCASQGNDHASPFNDMRSHCSQRAIGSLSLYMAVGAPSPSVAMGTPYLANCNGHPSP